MPHTTAHRAMVHFALLALLAGLGGCLAEFPADAPSDDADSQHAAQPPVETASGWTEASDDIANAAPPAFPGFDDRETPSDDADRTAAIGAAQAEGTDEVNADAADVESGEPGTDEIGREQAAGAAWPGSSFENESNEDDPGEIDEFEEMDTPEEMHIPDIEEIDALEEATEPEHEEVQCQPLVCVAPNGYAGEAPCVDSPVAGCGLQSWALCACNALPGAPAARLDPDPGGNEVLRDVTVSAAGLSYVSLFVDDRCLGTPDEVCDAEGECSGSQIFEWRDVLPANTPLGMRHFVTVITGDVRGDCSSGSAVLNLTNVW